MKPFTPQIGQFLYGQSWQPWDCPEYIVALLRYLDYEMDRVWRNNSIQYDSPFDNSGNVIGYRNDVFEVHAYDWGEEQQGFNFKYEDIEISWYKGLGRATTINRLVTPDEMVVMFSRCLESVRKEEKED